MNITYILGLIALLIFIIILIREIIIVDNMNTTYKFINKCSNYNKSKKVCIKTNKKKK